MKDKFSCFLHPKKDDYIEKSLNDKCPDCNLPYGFPLQEDFMPEKINEFKILQPLGRGFYGATYLAEKESKIRTKKVVLKIVPKKIYELFEKDFYNECKIHVEAAVEADHIANVDDAFEEDVEFKNGERIDCYVAILDYIEGQTLKSFISANSTIPIHTIAQIAIDCLQILSELYKKNIFHNDLHLGNLIVCDLKRSSYRQGEINGAIKVYVIDFGSSGSKSQSNTETDRLGDLHWVAKILETLSKKIQDSPGTSEERDFRLALLLDERAKVIFPSVSSQRVFSFEEVITHIRQVFSQVTSPWKNPLELRSFNDSYNAQTLSPWFVPYLLVDDEDKWISEITSRGPQVITGMRGCGKTMLLRALQFHARATPQNDTEKKDSSTILERLHKENYLGIYISCTRLLDTLGSHDQSLNSPFERLFVAYSLEALNAIRHLRELKAESIKPDAFKIIANVIESNINNCQILKEAFSEYEIEKALGKILNNLSKGEHNLKISSNPAIVFNELANAIKDCSFDWSSTYVHFLLDDVSTRFLNDQNIISLVSSLLFQSETCAFKFTTEAQTLEMVINSPGNIEQARVGRDYQIFDLGEQVNNKIHKNKNEGISFVEKILFKRSIYHSNHPKNISPSELLGNQTLQTIAVSIAKEGKSSSKKTIYHGITAIAGVCVGDIGDIITLYEKILKNWKTNTLLPINSKAQNEAYLELCNSRIFDINRRSTKLFDFAESFAEAAHHLLVQSYKKSKSSNKLRLRQYSSIFINISNGDVDQQNRQVRELIDAGIFNFSGGPEASRTNRQGLNPQQQYKLTFRKIYGLNKHIGLSQSDRFELSGEALEKWLNNPKDGKEILIRNLARDTVYDEVDALDSGETNFVGDKGYQTNLFDNVKFHNIDRPIHQDSLTFLEDRLPCIYSQEISIAALKKISHYISSYGFEYATLASAKNILSLKALSSIFIKFDEIGQKKRIKELANKFKLKSSEIDYKSFDPQKSLIQKSTLIDITGIPQSLIFKLVTNSLNTIDEVSIALTKAKKYYPLNEDITNILEKNKELEDKTEILKSISEVLKGEVGPYKIIPLLPVETNHSIRRVLVAFASAKHERLYSLLDEREFDRIVIITPKGKSSRNRLARIAAEIALTRFNNCELHEIDENSIDDTINFIAQQYQTYFINQNFSIEIALSGNKIQALSAAIVSQSLKINQCWYIQPSKWDIKRFTKGAEKTNIYTVKINHGKRR
ncbi:Protein kinase domain-containing protein [Pedobacter suwonensis]|uniref:Protein kinase domain-containing protein n=1 Tax=Pedobacter suwonensis TaxID=332999 RepID=A0A1I0TEJ5_9SPHI|nr:protein kinase [Pedobacter suwonensis]SFA50185.1 Protein kinase domain-containing protein [Pedobacter suwonensis]